MNQNNKDKNKNKKPFDDRADSVSPEDEELEAVVVEDVEILERDAPEQEENPEPAPLDALTRTKQEKLEAAIREQEDKYLRLLAEYDNFRKRSIKERDLAWSTSAAQTAASFFPIYDNLERALKQPCQDEAYAKGVQMTMNQLKSILEKLGIQEISSLDQNFDPTFHDAVMHVEDENLPANTIVEVFQTGFQSGEKVVRHAMVKVAN